MTTTTTPMCATLFPSIRRMFPRTTLAAPTFGILTIHRTPRHPARISRSRGWTPASMCGSMARTLATARCPTLPPSSMSPTSFTRARTGWPYWCSSGVMVRTWRIRISSVPAAFSATCTSWTARLPCFSTMSPQHHSRRILPLLIFEATTVAAPSPPPWNSTTPMGIW